MIKIILRCHIVLVFICFIINKTAAQKPDVKAVFKNAGQQVDLMLKEIGQDSASKNNNLVSPRTIVNNKLKMVASNDWTSGFFAGELWYLYQFDKNKKWLNLAKTFTQKIEKQKNNTGTHDLGFMVYCSFGNGYRLTQDTGYRSVIIQAAKSLSTRFNPITGVIRSWDHNADRWKNPVIIDNMMNLELLFEATKITGDSSFYKIAIAHANTTMVNHFRPDFSSYHVVDYDPISGKVIWQGTYQGFSDSSAWARGQAWALYGYTMCYRETHDKKYLNQAEHIAAFIIKNLPADEVPYWDFSRSGMDGEPRDASAASIMASALYELSWYNKSAGYKTLADNILISLSSNYQSPPNKNNGFILLHSTGFKPAKSEIDVPIVYADYYYLEAMLRSKIKATN